MNEADDVLVEGSKEFLRLLENEERAKSAGIPIRSSFEMKVKVMNIIMK